jgi:hypothetical protein
MAIGNRTNRQCQGDHRGFTSRQCQYDDHRQRTGQGQQTSQQGIRLLVQGTPTVSVRPSEKRNKRTVPLWPSMMTTREPIVLTEPLVWSERRKICGASAGVNRIDTIRREGAAETAGVPWSAQHLKIREVQECQSLVPEEEENVGVRGIPKSSKRAKTMNRGSHECLSPQHTREPNEKLNKRTERPSATGTGVSLHNNDRQQENRMN